MRYAALLVLTISFAAIADPQQAPEPIRVLVTVTANETDNAPLQSCLNREFRSLGALVSDTKPDFRIQVVMMQPKVDGRSSGYAASVVVLRMGAVNLVHDWLITKDDILRAEALEGAGHAETIWVMTDSDLTSICKRIVASIDVVVLEPLRQFQQSIEDLINEKKVGGT